MIAKANQAKHMLLFEESEDLLAEIDIQPWIGSFGPEVMVECAGEDSHQLLWLETEPAMRNDLKTRVRECRLEYLRMIRHLGIAGEFGLKGAMRNVDAAQKQYMNQAIGGARDMNRKKMRKTVEKRKVPSKKLLFEVQVWHELVAHQTALLEDEKKNHKIPAGVVRSKEEKVSRYQNELKNDLGELITDEEFVPLAPLLPPLHSFRVLILKAPSSVRDHLFAQTSVVPGKIYFIWPRRQDGQTHIAIHGAVEHNLSWHLQESSYTSMLHLAPGASVAVYPDTDGQNVCLDFPLDDGQVSVQLVDGTGLKSLDLVEQWSKELWNPDFWPEPLGDGDVSVTLTTRPFGWHAQPRHVALRRGLRRPYDKDSFDGAGFILAEIVPGSQAEQFGLKHGMELRSIAGRDVRQVHSLRIAQYLLSEPLPINVVFTMPLRPDFTVSLDGIHGLPALDVRHRGMVLLLSDTSSPKKSKGSALLSDMFRLRDFDEIVVVDDKPCYDALGSSARAHKEFMNMKRTLREGGTVTLGVARPCAQRIPSWLSSFARLPCFFRYNSGYCLPHTSAGPFSVYMLDNRQDQKFNPRPFLCDMWLSHLGLVLSIQPKQWSTVCFGMYLQDVVDVRAVPAVEDSLEADTDSHLWATPSCLWRIHLTIKISSAASPHGVMHQISESRDLDGDSRFAEVVIGSLSRWVMVKFHVRIVQALRSTYMASGEETGAGKVETEDILFPGTSIRENMMTAQAGSNYETTYQAFENITAADTQTVKVGDVASKVTYHFWPQRRLATTVLKREHIIPKLFKRLPPITRVERYATLSSALQTAFFVQTALFSPHCFMAPKPATCSTKKASWFDKFAPTFATFAACIFGLCMSVPVPFLLTTCFKKTPVMEKLTPQEKHFRIRTWRFWQVFGWAVVLFLHGIYGYWLTIFSNEYDWPVFGKWVNAGVQSLFHRFLSAPFIRGFVFLLILMVSLVVPFVDPMLAYFPHILPVEPIKTPAPASPPPDHEVDAGGDHVGVDDGSIGFDAVGHD